MNKCLYCYQKLENEIDFHLKCVKTFFGSNSAPILPYNFDELNLLAKKSIEKSITVTGVQPKLSLGLIDSELQNGYKGRLTILNALDGNYILKPQNILYEQMPENEHLSMKLAQLFNIEVVSSTLIRLASGELCYLTKRIDRPKLNTKMHLIDFLQILELEDKSSRLWFSINDIFTAIDVMSFLQKRITKKPLNYTPNVF